ncbi:MAG: LD-carboxypeptidase [Lachnospiraceae bacterium]|nr:LD-carboxypeptidase [Lachnospiraceae bacterium]
MRYPAFLADHGRIGFAAPSFGCSFDPYKAAFENALRRFEQMGFTCQLGPNVWSEEGIGISSTPPRCAAEFMDAWLSDTSDALISVGGGELMCEILPCLDFDKLAQSAPKWFMGYSDNTNIGFLLATLTDTASIYGPCASTFGMEPWHPSIEDAFALLRGEKLTFTGYPAYELESNKSAETPLATINATQPRQLHSFLPGGGQVLSAGMPTMKETRETIEFSGRLIGGCLDCLGQLVGTTFDQVAAFADRYREDGLIWFLEACDLNVYSIRRAIWQLKNAGWFKYTKGFLIGRPLSGMEEMFGLDRFHAVTDLLDELGVPVIMDLDIGHIAPMMPLINGSLAHVHCQDQDFSIRMELR